MILVKVYCASRGCAKLLATIADPLPELGAVPRNAVGYTAPRCPRHGGTFERGFDPTKPPRQTVTLQFGQPRIPPEVLWPLIDTARRTGRTQTYGV